MQFSIHYSLQGIFMQASPTRLSLSKASLSRKIWQQLFRNALTPHLFHFSMENSVCLVRFSLAATKRIINLFSFPAGTKMFQFPAFSFSVNFLRTVSDRKSRDQRLRAATSSLSQLATSFEVTQTKLSV